MRSPARACRNRSAAGVAAALLWLLSLLAASAPPAASLVVNVQTPDGHALPGAVVTVRSLDTPGRHAPPVHAVMDQVNRSFAPDLLVIPVGSTVEFPNSDSVSHQIYSFSPAKRFQLPLYRGKPYPPVRFDQPGVVTLGCNIHDEMLAYLLVTDAAWYGRTNDGGTFSAEVPRGRYHVELWHPRLRDNESDLARELSVGEGDRAELTLHLTRGLQPSPLSDRPRSSDY
jgi:plastocyanin